MKRSKYFDQHASTFRDMPQILGLSLQANEKRLLGFLSIALVIGSFGSLDKQTVHCEMTQALIDEPF
jgi:hypothetical protein